MKARLTIMAVICLMTITANAQTDSSAVCNDTIVAMSDTTVTEMSQSPVFGVSHFVSDLNLRLQLGSEDISLSGKASAKWNEVVRINLTFMGLMEVAILEFTPDHVLIVNRMEKQYTLMPYDTTPLLRQNGITFATAQELAWSKVYSEEKQKIEDQSLDSMVESMFGGKAKVTIKIGRPDTEREFNTCTTPSSRYTEVPASELIKRLSNIRM